MPQQAQSDATTLVVPPLPSIPEAPLFPPDPRQSFFHGIMGAVVPAVPGDARVTMINTARGYPASAVDLGRLKSAMERGLRGLDADAVKARFDSDLGSWIVKFLSTWVQRCKQIDCEWKDDCLHVFIRPEDDEGWYEYRFALRVGIEATAD